MRYEIIKLDGLYVVFRNETIMAAFEKKADAVEAIEKYRASRKEKEK